MNDKLTFCEYCREDVFYIEKDEYMSSDIKGETYNYYGKKAICNECNNEIFAHEINDYNLNQLYIEFRKENNIIQLEDILEIPKRYNIGKRPLSLLLGWGEQTFSRYCDGDMPTKQYSMILEKIFDDPVYYLSLLEENKNRLKSQSAYEKSKEATQLMIREKQILGENKIDLVVDYLLCECEDITPLALQKILYYIQGFSHAFLKRFIFEENCEAWVHGPVYRDIYYKYREYKFDPIKGFTSTKDLNLTVSEKAIVDSVIKNLGCYSGKVLEEFTHAEMPWLETRGDLSYSEGTDRMIQKNLIADYFTEVKEKNNMINPSDIGVYSKKMFEQIYR